MLIELFAPKGALTAQRREAVAQRLLAEVTYHEGTPADALEAARALFHVIVHEPEAWATGRGPAEPPRYLVRVSVPGGSMVSDEGRAHYISTITRVLADTYEDSERPYREPLVSVHIVEVPEGAFGSLGRALREADLVQLVMGADGPGTHSARPIEPGADTAIDPICGMTVELTGTAITLGHDGATYAFCCNGCRDVFAERLAGSAR